VVEEVATVSTPPAASSMCFAAAQRFWSSRPATSGTTRSSNSSARGLDAVVEAFDQADFLEFHRDDLVVHQRRFE
jgi:hypothetical protein